MKNIIIILCTLFTLCACGQTVNPVVTEDHIATFSFDTEQCEPLASANGRYWLDYWDWDSFDPETTPCHVYWDGNNPWIVVDIPAELWNMFLEDYYRFQDNQAPLHMYGISFKDGISTLVLITEEDDE